MMDSTAVKTIASSLGKGKEPNETAAEPRRPRPALSRNVPPLDLSLARSHSDSTQDAATSSSSSSSAEGNFRGFRLHFPGFSSRQNSLQDDDDKEKNADSTLDEQWPALVDDGQDSASLLPCSNSATPSPVFLLSKKRLYNVPKARKRSNATKKLRLDSVTVGDQQSGQIDSPVESRSSTCSKQLTVDELPIESLKEKPKSSKGSLHRQSSLDSIQGVDDTLAYIRKIVADTSKKMEQLCNGKKDDCEQANVKAQKDGNAVIEPLNSAETAVVDDSHGDGEESNAQSGSLKSLAQLKTIKPSMDIDSPPGTSNSLGEGTSGNDKSSQVDAPKPFSPFWHWPSPSGSPKVAVVNPLSKPVLPKHSADDSGNLARTNDQSRASVDRVGQTSSSSHQNELGPAGHGLSRPSSRWNHSGALPQVASTSGGRGVDGGLRECMHGSEILTPTSRRQKKAHSVRPVHSFATREKGVSFLDTSSSDSEDDCSRWLTDTLGSVPSRSRKRGTRTTKSCSHLVHRRPILDSTSDSELESFSCCSKVGEFQGSSRPMQCPQHKIMTQSKKQSAEWVDNVNDTHPCVMRNIVTPGPDPSTLRSRLLVADNSSDSDSPLMLRRCRQFQTGNPNSSSKSKMSLSGKRNSYRRPFELEDSSSNSSEADLNKAVCSGNEVTIPSREKLTHKLNKPSNKWKTLFNRPLDPNVFTADSSDDEQPSPVCHASSGNASNRPWGSHNVQLIPFDDSTDSDGEPFRPLSPPPRRVSSRSLAGRRAVAHGDEDHHHRSHSSGGRLRQGSNLHRNAHSTPDLHADTTITLDEGDEMDSVRQIEQIEADEAYARMLQAQFDAELAATIPQSSLPVISDVEVDASYIPPRGLSSGQHRYPRTRQSARMTCPTSTGYRNQRVPTTRQATARSPSQQSLLNASRHRQGCSRMRGSHDSLTTLLPMLEDVVGNHGNLVNFLSSIANLPVIRPADASEGGRGWPSVPPAGSSHRRRRAATTRNAISDESDIDPILFVGDPIEYLLYTDDEDDRWPASGLRRSTHGGPGARRRTPRGQRNRGTAMAGAALWAFNEGNDYEELLELAERLGHVSRGLSHSQVNRLPTRLFSRGEATAASNSQRSTECHICMSDYETGERLRILPCFHEFHTNCIDRWLVEKNTCPVCRLRVQVN